MGESKGRPEYWSEDDGHPRCERIERGQGWGEKRTFSVFKTALKTRRGSLARVLGRIGVARRCDATRRDATRGGAIRSDPKARPDETVDEASRGA